MARPKTEVASYKKLLLRLPEAMLAACQSSAQRDRRSINAQILHILDEWFQEKRPHVSAPSGGSASCLLMTFEDPSLSQSSAGLAPGAAALH